MAEKNDTWFGSWLSAAKTKSCEVLEFVKKDLEEFGSAVRNEASSVVSSTGTVIEKTLKLDEPESTASTMKRSISSFLGQMNEVLNPSPDDSDTEAIMIVEGDGVTLTKQQQAIYTLQKNEKTFLEDPDETLKKQYECWLEIIEDNLSDMRLCKHLKNSETLKNQYTSLVPLKVEHGLFWKRYLFKKALLEDEIARQEALEKREAKENIITEETVQWDEEDFNKDIELSEEEQIRLLEQYENETKQKSQSRKTSASSTRPVGEDILFEQETKKSKSNKKKDRKPTTDVDNIKAMTENSSSSSSSTDGDWEKISPENDK